MHPAATEAIEREGWRLLVADAGLTPELREAVVARSLDGGARCTRRAQAPLAPCQHLADSNRLARRSAKSLSRCSMRRAVSPSSSVCCAAAARITSPALLSGSTIRPFSRRRFLLHGHALASASEIMVTPRADGDGPLRTLRALRAGPLNRKRAVLHALGAEIARLHRCGFVHGDLTPFNIFFIPAEPPRFVLIDHERTRRAGLLGRRRQMLRNLVQLGRFDLPGVTATDRMRVLAGYVAYPAAARAAHARAAR